MNEQVIITFTQLAYLIASVFFILGIKNLSSPKTARRGNFFAMFGMFIAIVTTLTHKEIVDFKLILAGIIVGSAIGLFVGKKIEMTAMPQMVALFNGFGGLASTLVAMAEFYIHDPKSWTLDVSTTVILSLFVGGVTFTGSIVAFAKLQELIKSSPVVFKMQQVINGILFVVFIVASGFYLYDTTSLVSLIVVLVVGLLLGILLVIPIGGADMPVVISLLNSYSGIAAATTGFILSNSVLIISGALVGASGIILTQIMCKAMNRSLVNVIFGAVGGEVAASGGKKEKRTVTNYTEEDAASILDSAQSVIIVPGYGLAVAQAQHVLQEMGKMLIAKGVSVRYAIHPVAGRMPGHMNVLLAESNVPYDLLCDLDQINEDFQNTDVVLVIGANDVINPAARTQKDSPLFGMPILNVDKAKSAIIIKRSLSPGFAGVDNELFYDKKTMMIFKDAKDGINKIIAALKEL